MKAALIGTGQIAQQHLACLLTLPEVILAGVCDLSRAMAESTAERFGAATWFTDHRAMLDGVVDERRHHRIQDAREILGIARIGLCELRNPAQSAGERRYRP